MSSHLILRQELSTTLTPDPKIIAGAVLLVNGTTSDHRIDAGNQFLFVKWLVQKEKRYRSSLRVPGKLSSHISVVHGRHLCIAYDDFRECCLCEIYRLSAFMSGEHTVAGLAQRCLQFDQEFYIIIDQKYAGRNHICVPFLHCS